ncbi:hypothetical protein [Treponema sp.]|uniref:hypothetical protein n=1 Tax=Treponema sp. TaxID=166 RepID=UPI00298D8FE8|nr:hypothetical protein [Treponema sp.]MCR5612696.1 hypothetical protein [Treponema sp.]
MAKSKCQHVCYFLIHSMLYVILMILVFVNKITSINSMDIIILFSVFYTISSICLTFILVKSDDKVRFEKLKALMEIEKKISDKEKRPEIEEEYSSAGKIKSKKIDCFGDLTKVLMNSITEI